MSLRFETTPSYPTQLDFISHSPVDIFPVGSDLESPITWYRKPTDKAIYETKLPDKMIEDILNQSEVLDVSDPLIYEAYIAKLKAEHLAEYGHFANKANIQLECQKLGINEDTTRIIAPRDLGTLFKYVKGLTDQGRIVWIGSSTKDDMTDPWGDKSNINNSVTPPLYKKITSLEDLLSILPSINMFKNSHPDMLLKVFPQDGESPTLTSIVFEYNDQSKKISFHFKPGQFTPDGLRSEKASRTIDIEVDLNHDIPLITIENESDLEWVEIVLNSLGMFSKVKQIDFKNSPVVNVEAMHLNSDSFLRFVTDIIYGNGDKKKKYKQIPFLKMLKSIRDGIVVYKKSPIKVSELLNNSNNLIRTLNIVLDHAHNSTSHIRIPNITEIDETLVMLDQKDIKAMSKMISSSQAERKIIEAELLARIKKYVSPTILFSLQLYLKSIDKVGDGATKASSTIATETLSETILQYLPAVVEESLAMRSSYEQELAHTLVQLVSFPSFYNYHFSIPQSIIRSLEHISQGKKPHESTTKALLYLSNHLQIGNTAKLISPKVKQLNNSGKWQIIH